MNARLLFLFMLLSPLLVFAASAGEAASTHRVTGLFSPDREADLRKALEQLPGVKLTSVDFEHAEAVFSYDPAIAFKDTKPENLIERFNDRLRAASNSTLGIAPVCATPKDKLTRIEIPAGGLDCKACALAAYESIYRIDGVAAAAVSFREGRITALIDPAKTNRDTLVEALKRIGVEIVSTP